jgi:hypothetical protein
VQHHFTELERFLQVFAAISHQLVVFLDLYAEGLDFDELGDEVRRAVEEGAREHGALHPFALWVGLAFEGAAGVVEARARNVEAMLHVGEKAAGQRFDEALLRRQGIGRHVVGADPIAVVVDAQPAFDDALRSAGDVRTHGTSDRCAEF